MRVFVTCLVLLAFLIQGRAHAEVPASWTTALAPFQIADNLYYVGSQELASYLVVTPEGNILINANLASAPAQIRASVEKLGFRWNDTKILLNSQAHSDHVGGAAAIIRETRARNMVMDGDADMVETGGKTDFTSPSPPDKTLYAPARVDRVLHDRDTVSLGGVTLTAHKTAGHTRGTTTWTMRSHLPGEPAGTARDIVIVGGTGFWSEYRFVARPGRPASYPGIAEDFEKTFAALRALPCDVFLGAHGGYFDLLPKLQRYSQVGPRAFVDAEGYKQFVASSEAAFKKALLKQRAAATE
jgi:metallo-beta-lactamase class B